MAHKFSRLWGGDTSGYDTPSEATAALCLMLAYWTDKDPGRMDRLFRQSGLMRDKWDRPQGLPGWTITKALDGMTEITRAPGAPGLRADQNQRAPRLLIHRKHRNRLRSPHLAPGGHGRRRRQFQQDLCCIPRNAGIFPLYGLPHRAGPCDFFKHHPALRNQTASPACTPLTWGNRRIPENQPR